MDGFLVMSRQISAAVHRVLGLLASCLLIGVVLFALLEIIRRYILGVVFEWGQDAIIITMVSAVALSFAVTQARRGHLVMAVFAQVLHSRGHYTSVGLMKIFVSASIVIFCASIGFTGSGTFIYAWERDISTESLYFPLWPVYGILIFGFCLMAFIAFLQLIEDVVGFARGEHLTEELSMTTDV